MRLGAYEVIAELGRGGMGVVYRARSSDGREVALKLLRHATGESLARFERERRLAGDFTARDGFVPLLEAASSPTGPILVMPLLEGGTLRARLERGPLGVDETLELGRALAAALGRAHARGIVHRDVKPENVLFTKDGAPLVGDLGLAKHFDRDALGASQSVGLSARGMLRGTAGYMAPEQMADAIAATPAADVFALGAVLWECLAGRPAFMGETALDVISAVSAGEVPSVRELRPEVPAWLARILERALAPSPERRFANGAELARALAGPSRRRVLALVALGALIAAAGAGATLVRRSGPRATEAPPPPTRSKKPPAPPPARPSDDPPPVDARAVLESDPAHQERHRRAEATRAALEAGDRASAEAFLAEPVAGTTECADLVGMRGTLLFALGRLAEAEQAYSKAYDMEPTAVKHLGNRGLVREKLERYQDALADFEKALAPPVVKGMAPAVVAYARVLCRLGRPADAERTFAEALSVYQASVTRLQLYADRARLCWMPRKRYAEAEADLTEALKLAPEDFKLRTDRGDVRSERGDASGAIADWKAALGLKGVSPTDAERLRDCIRRLEAR